MGKQGVVLRTLFAPALLRRIDFASWEASVFRRRRMSSTATMRKSCMIPSIERIWKGLE